MKSYKQLITGIAIGATAATAVAFAGDLRTFVATEADFPVVVNGSPVTLDMPVVTIQDRTYLPLRAMGDILGVSVDWDGSQAVVTTDATPEPTATPMPSDIISPENIYDQYTTDGLPITYHDNVPYVEDVFIIRELEKRGHKHKYNFDTENLCSDNGTVIIPNIPHPYNATAIPLDFYYEKISPWLETIQPK